MRTILFAAVLLFCLHLPGYAQEDTSAEEAVIEEYAEDSDEEDDHALVPPEELNTTREYTTQSFIPREFDEDKWKAIVNGVDYTEEVARPKKQKSSSPWGGKILKFISYFVIAALLIAVIYYVTRYLSFDMKIERTELDAENLEAPVEDIAELDIARMLEQAKRDRNYKLAVRLYYLGLLKKLNDKGAIVWKKDKTNRDYLTELFSANVFFDEVRRLTLSYEAVWYGDHDLNAETFGSLTTQFESIYGKINPKESA